MVRAYSEERTISKGRYVILVKKKVGRLETTEKGIDQIELETSGLQRKCDTHSPGILNNSLNMENSTN